MEHGKVSDLLDGMDRKILGDYIDKVEELPLIIDVPKLEELERNPYAE